MIKFLLSVVLSFLLSPQIVMADFDSEKWAWSKEIRLPQLVSQSKLVTFSLDREVFDNAKNGLSDLRLIDSEGKETPYKLIVENTTVSRDSFSARITNLGSTGEYTQLVLDLGKDGVIHNNVTLSTSNVNFRRQVEVETSSDGNSWLLVKKADEGSYIYDYSLDFKAKNTTVYYPESTYRFLRLKIIDKGEESIKVNGATVYNFLQSSSRQVTYEPKQVDKSEDEELRASRIILDLEYKGIPSNQATFVTRDANFNREVLVEGTNDKTNWQQLGRDVIFSYDTPKFVGAKTSVNFSESNFRYLRLTIYNRDNQPINLSDFSVSGTLRKVLFQAEPDKLYKLYFGNQNARFAEYDLESYLRYLDTNTAQEAVLGQQVKNETFKGPIPPAKPLSEKYPFLLPGVLGVMVIVLGTMVFRLAFAVKRR